MKWSGSAAYPKGKLRVYFKKRHWLSKSVWSRHLVSAEDHDSFAFLQAVDDFNRRSERAACSDLPQFEALWGSLHVDQGLVAIVQKRRRRHGQNVAGAGKVDRRRCRGEVLFPRPFLGKADKAFLFRRLVRQRRPRVRVHGYAVHAEMLPTSPGLDVDDQASGACLRWRD